MHHGNCQTLHYQASSLVSNLLGKSEAYNLQINFAKGDINVQISIILLLGICNMQSVQSSSQKKKLQC